MRACCGSEKDTLRFREKIVETPRKTERDAQRGHQDRQTVVETIPRDTALRKEGRTELQTEIWRPREGVRLARTHARVHRPTAATHTATHCADSLQQSRVTTFPEVARARPLLSRFPVCVCAGGGGRGVCPRVPNPRLPPGQGAQS
jgi:hypothetical protein